MAKTGGLENSDRPADLGGMKPLSKPIADSQYARAFAARDLDALRRFVHDVLCRRDRLHAPTTPLFEAEIAFRDKPAGKAFHVEGPRNLRPSALWSSEEARLIFFDSQGVRFHEARLTESPAGE